MSSDHSLNDRRRALQDSFFAKRNVPAPERLPSESSTDDQRKALAAVSGIKDGAVIDHLLAAEIEADTITALGMVPLLAVAWADGRLNEDERRAVLTGCESEGISAGSEGFLLLDHWLQEHPSDQLLSAWKDFIVAARRQLSQEAMVALKEDVLSRAKKVAQFSGSLRGAQTVSAAEQRILDELRQAFEGS